jgi:acetyltransferase
MTSGDCYQGHELGTEIVGRLIRVGRDEKLQEIVVKILPENRAMRALPNHFGFKIRKSDDPCMIVPVLSL